MSAERESRRGVGTAVTLSVGICLVALLGVLLYWLAGQLGVGPWGATAPYPSPRPCTLGALPPGAPTTGGIIAVEVTSTYPNPETPAAGPPYREPTYARALCILRVSDGALLASYPLAAHDDNVPFRLLGVATDGGALYVVPHGSTPRLCAMRPLTGATLWCNASLTEFTSVVVTQRVVYVASLTSLTAIDTATGKTLWQNLSATADFSRHLVSLSANVIIGLTSDDIAPQDGVCAWSLTTGARVWCVHSFQNVIIDQLDVDSANVGMSMRFANGTVVVEQLDAATGQVAWKLTMTTNPLYLYTSTDGVTFLSSTGCTLDTVDCPTTIEIVRTTTGATLGQFAINRPLHDLLTSGDTIITSTYMTISGRPIPGASPPGATFSYNLPGLTAGRLIATGGGVLYEGVYQLGLIDAATGAPVWEATGGGDPRTGSAAASHRNGMAVWLHWTAGTEFTETLAQGMSW